MQAEVRKKMAAVYQAALAQPAERRTEFLARACPNAQVRTEVESLLKQDFNSFPEGSPVSPVGPESGWAISGCWNGSGAAGWARCGGRAMPD